MGFVADFISFFTNSNSTEFLPSQEIDRSGLRAGRAFTWSYDGEKNMGELGPAVDYSIDYETLRIRSWQSYIESEITLTVVNRFTLWAVGSGLKLQSDPDLEVLDTEGIDSFTADDKAKFARLSEHRFKIWSKNKFSTHSERSSLNRLERKILKHAKVGGDCLVVLRSDGENPTVEMYDGAHIKTPFGMIDGAKGDNGNRIIKGVEIDSRNRHVAYHVAYREGLKYHTERIPAKGKNTGLTMAFMVYGSEYRVDSVRGMPLIAVCLETIKKLERYKEATVGSAEERQKIVYQIVHGAASTGESVLLQRAATAAGVGNGNTNVPTDKNGDEVANKVAVSTNKQTFNMPIDSKMESLDSKAELHFGDFYNPNFDIICAAIGIPPNVARMKYDDSYSSSRAAIKDWEHTLRVERDELVEMMMSPIYGFWLWNQVMTQKVQVNGYLEAYAKRNRMALAAFSESRWLGAQVPHIDPLKEVKAEREKLGPLGKDVPLSTVEQATEVLGTGDAEDNANQFLQEVKRFKPEPQKPSGKQD